MSIVRLVLKVIAVVIALSPFVAALAIWLYGQSVEAFEYGFTVEATPGGLVLFVAIPVLIGAALWFGANLLRAR